MAAEAQYIAGFLDGDGHIGIRPPTRHEIRPSPIVTAKQSYNHGEPPELLFLQNRFAGGIHKRTEATRTARSTWVFQAYVSSVQEVLSVVAEYGIIKKPQADIAREYSAGERAMPEYYARKILDAREDVKSVPIDIDRLTMPYLAGLFAADGSVGIHRTPDRGCGYRLVSSIRQTSCPGILHAIKKKLGYGSVTKSGELKFAPKASAKFLESIQPFVKKSQKRRQIKLAQKYIEHIAARSIHRGMGVRLPDTERKIIEGYAKEIANLKKR